MNGDRDVIHVSKSANPRTSPSVYRKCARGCSPSNLPVSKSSVFSSSISKGQSMNSARRTRSSISETLLLPSECERKRVAGGRTHTNRSTVLTFSTPDIVVQDVTKDDQLNFPVMPKSSEEEMEKRNGCLLSDDGLYERVPDSLRQPSCSEKVSKWLEDSQHSTLTDLSDNRSVAPDEDPEVNKKDDDHKVTGRVTCCKGTRISEAEDYEDRRWPAENALGIIPTALSPEKIRPTSWENYEPPPT